MSLIDRLIGQDRDCPRRILVIGDGMTDVYVHGRTEACQEGCPKFIEQMRVIVPGGACNAARSLHYWKSEATCISGSGHSAPVKIRFMDGDQCVFRHDDDRGYTDPQVIRLSALAALRDWRPHAVLLSDYDKGVLTKEFIADVVVMCRQRGIPCVADVKREPDVYAGCILKGNQTWDRTYERQKIDTVGAWVITQGDGPPYGYDNNTAWTINPHKQHVQCVNYVGAGDCFAAHLTLALAHGFSLKGAAAIAHSAGRVYVQHRHNRPPEPVDIRADMLSAG